MTGDPRFTVNRVTKGSQYAYRVDLRFGDSQASGTRTQTRPCTLTFAK